MQSLRLIVGHEVYLRESVAQHSRLNGIFSSSEHSESRRSPTLLRAKKYIKMC